MKIENIWIFTLARASLIDDRGNRLERPSVESEIPTMIIRVVYSLQHEEVISGVWRCLVLTLQGTPVADVRPILPIQRGPGIFSTLIPVPASYSSNQEYDIAVIPPGDQGTSASAVARLTD